MGVDARLLLNPRWDIEDIVDVLETYLSIKTEKVESRAKIHSTYFNVFCDNGRMINLHFNYNTPLGTATLLSLRANNEAQNMLIGIAKILGGFYNAEDYNDNWEDYRGLFWEEDGLPYHYKYAAIHNKITDNDDMLGLKQSIAEWHTSLRKKT